MIGHQVPEAASRTGSTATWSPSTRWTPAEGRADSARRCYTRWDTHSPFVLHRLDAAMGSTNSFCLTSCLGALHRRRVSSFSGWTNAFDYPFLISGKPLFQPAGQYPCRLRDDDPLRRDQRPLGMLARRTAAVLARLRRNRSFKRVTDDSFFISVEAADLVGPVEFVHRRRGFRSRGRRDQGARRSCRVLSTTAAISSWCGRGPSR